MIYVCYKTKWGSLKLSEANHHIQSYGLVLWIMYFQLPWCIL